MSNAYLAATQQAITLALAFLGIFVSIKKPRRKSVYQYVVLVAFCVFGVAGIGATYIQGKRIDAGSFRQDAAIQRIDTNTSKPQAPPVINVSPAQVTVRSGPAPSPTSPEVLREQRRATLQSRLGELIGEGVRLVEKCPNATPDDPKFSEPHDKWFVDVRAAAVRLDPAYLSELDGGGDGYCDKLARAVNGVRMIAWKEFSKEYKP